MTIDEQIARAKELIAKREEIDQQLAELFAGLVPAEGPIRCKSCGAIGPNANGRPTKSSMDDKISTRNSGS